MLNQKQANMVFLAAYNVDAFRDFLANTGMLGRLELSEERQAAILKDESERLLFAMDWLELALFGLERNLKKKA